MTPNLTRKLVLETPVRQPDRAGGYQKSWQTLGTLWADMQPGLGRRNDQGDAPIAATAWRILVRGAPSGNSMRPAPAQRFRDGGRVFRIDAVAEFDPEGRYLTCFAKEEIAQ